MTVFREIRSHKWIAARALLTGWGLWILSLVWFFPFVLLFAGSIPLMNILLFARFAVNVGSRAAYAFAGPLSLYVLASVGGILLGGLLCLSFKRENREARAAD